MRLCRYCCAVALVLAVLASNTLFQVSAESNATNTFTIQGWQNTPYVCWFWSASFSLAGGEEVSVSWSTSSQIPTAVDLYIAIPSAAGARWLCDIGPETLYYHSGAFGSTSWVAPTTGTYALLVVNNAHSTVSGTLSLVAGNASLPLSATGYGSRPQFPIPDPVSKS